MKKLLIIPAYNEAKNLVNMVREIEQYAPTFDYLVVNDGSMDDTREICRTNRLNAVHLCNNLGIGGAVQTGYQYAMRNSYDIAVQIDGDGQHDPAYLDKLLQPILEDRADFVIGSRFIQGEGFQSSGIRRVGIQWLNMVLRLITGLKITDATSGFRACNSACIAVFSQNYPKDYPEPETISDLNRHRMRITETSVVMRERQTGVSSIRLFKPIYYMVKVTLAILISKMKKRTV